MLKLHLPRRRQITSSTIFRSLLGTVGVYGLYAWFYLSNPNLSIVYEKTCDCLTGSRGLIETNPNGGCAFGV